MRSRRWVVVALVAGGLGVGSGVARGQGVPRIGTQVVTKYKRPLRVGDQIVGDDGFRVYTVVRVNGNWLRLVSGRVVGWIRSSEVVPFDRAIDFYTQEIRAHPGDASPFVWRGIIWSEKGQPDLALADCTKAIRLDPTNSLAYYNRGIAWSDKREYDRAIADYNRAFRLGLNDAHAFHRRGNAWSAKERYDQAIIDYSRAIRLDPTRAIFFRCRGDAWGDKHEYDKAIADYNEAIRLDPGDALSYANRGIVWWLKHDPDKTLADYNEALRLDPRLALAHTRRGNYWWSKQDYDKAIADLNEAVRLDPESAAAFNDRAWMWATCPDEGYRDGKKAVESATRACELSQWKDARVIDTLAAAYAEAGDFARAVEFQAKANALYTDEKARNRGEGRLKLYQDKKPYRDQSGR